MAAFARCEVQPRPLRSDDGKRRKNVGVLAQVGRVFPCHFLQRLLLRRRSKLVVIGVGLRFLLRKIKRGSSSWTQTRVPVFTLTYDSLGQTPQFVCDGLLIVFERKDSGADGGLHSLPWLLSRAGVPMRTVTSAERMRTCVEPIKAPWLPTTSDTLWSLTE
jgi:hypothetical protein